MFYRLVIAILVIPALVAFENEEIWDEQTPDLISKTTGGRGTSSGCPFGRRSRPAEPCDKLTPNPGAAWSDEEIMIVRAKLTRIFSVDEGTNRIVKELYPSGKVPFAKWQAWRDGVTASKVLRLGFHDCMKYRDGTGGCDGCINWSGMGLRYDEADWSFSEGIWQVTSGLVGAGYNGSC